MTVEQPRHRRGWIIDIVAGVTIGALVSAIVAVNVVIFAGIDDGYEASLSEVFAQNKLVGVLTVGILFAGPILGVVYLRRQRDRRSQPG